MGSTLSRLEREALQAGERRLCAEQGSHPFRRLFWQPGDWSTPDYLVCGRCYKTLRARPHRTTEPPAPRRPLPVYDRRLHDEPPPGLPR